MATPIKQSKLSVQWDKTEKILVCICKHYGDVLLASPIFHLLKKRAPNAHIAVYLYENTKSMLEGNPYIDEYIFTPSKKKRSLYKKFLEESKILRTIRRKKFDLSINMTAGDRGALAVFASKAKIRVGFRREDHRGFFCKEKMFTHLLQNLFEKRHAVDKYLDVVRVLGILPSEKEMRVVFSIPKHAEESLKEKFFLEEFIVIAPTSTLSFKQWPARYFAKVINSLEIPCVLVGGKEKREEKFAHKIQTLAENSVTNLVGELSLKELGSVIQKSQMVISVDSMPAHIASSMQKPLIVLFGPSDEITWGPWQNPHAHVVRSYHARHKICKACKQEGCGNSWYADCLENLDPEIVINLARQKTSSTKKLLTI